MDEENQDEDDLNEPQQSLISSTSHYPEYKENGLNDDLRDLDFDLEDEDNEDENED